MFFMNDLYNITVNENNIIVIMYNLDSVYFDNNEH